MLLQTIVSGLLLGGIYALLSLSVALLIIMLDLANFAHGALVMFAMYSMWLIGTSFSGWNVFAYLLIAALLFLIAGVLVYLGMFRPLIGQTSDKQILFTWGLALTLENIALAIWKADPRMFFNPLRYTGIQIGGVMINYAMLLSFSVAVVLTVAIFLFLHKTDRGRLLRAAITNRDLVKFLGVNPDSVFLQGTMFSFVLAAVGGFLLALYYPVFPSVGQHYLFIMFVAIVLGGSGKIEGALVGGLLVGLIQEISATYLPTNFELLVVFIIFIIALNFRPRGLLGGR